MEGNVYTGSGEVELRVTSNAVEWKPTGDVKKKSTMKHSRLIPIEDVISVDNVVDKRQCFELRWVIRQPKYILRVNSQVFTSGDETQCEQWVSSIRDSLSGLPNKRPRRLLVLINPQSGRRKAPQLYRTNAAPVFKMANVETDVIVTERKRHAVDVILDYDLERIDCIVCVGGDGTFSECMNGLMRRTMNDEGLDSASSHAEVATPKIKMAPMAGGSANAITHIQYGTGDFETAALHIILGNEGTPVDIGSYFCGSHFLGYGFLMAALGFCCDYMYEAEKKRKFQFLGPFRYGFPFLKNILRPQPIDLEIQYKKSESLQNDDPGTSTLPSDTIDDTFLDFVVWPKVFYFEDDRLTFAPHRANLYIVRQCSAVQHLQFFPRMIGKRADADVQYVSKLSVDELHVRIKGGGRKRENDMYVVNIDGEISALPEPLLHVRFHRNTISCYGCIIPSSDD